MEKGFGWKEVKRREVREGGKGNKGGGIAGNGELGRGYRLKGRGMMKGLEQGEGRRTMEG